MPPSRAHPKAAHTPSEGEAQIRSETHPGHEAAWPSFPLLHVEKDELSSKHTSISNVVEAGSAVHSSFHFPLTFPFVFFHNYILP